MRKKMKILATNSYSSGCGQHTEAAQMGSGLLTFCLRNNIFDTNPPEDVERLFGTMLSKKVSAAIIDNYWMGLPGMSISYSQIDFAKRLREINVETFFLGRGRRDWEFELWRAHKPCMLRDMERPVLQFARIGVFGRAIFYAKNNSVIKPTGGDGTAEQIEHMLREGLTYRERDWPSIVEAVEQELI